MRISVASTCPLQSDGGLARCEQPDKGDEHNCGEQYDEGEGKGFAIHGSLGFRVKLWREDDIPSAEKKLFMIIRGVIHGHLR